MNITRLRLGAAAAVVAAASLLLAGCAGSADPGTSQAAADPDSLVLALVPSQDQNGLVDTAKPLTDMLTEKLGIPVTGVVAKDYQAAVEAMGAGQAQIGFLPSLQLWQASDKYGAKVVLQTERNGNITYPAQFMTNNPDKYCDDTPVERDGMLISVSDVSAPREGETVERRQVRYRTVGDMSCTGAVESDAATVDDVIVEVAATRLTERGATRADDRASEAAMEDRKKEGYF